MKRIVIILISLFTSFGYSNAQAAIAYSGRETQQAPWFTGPLIGDSGEIIPLGNYDIQPFVTVLDNYGTYDNNWNLQKTPALLNTAPLFEISFGTSKYTDIEISVPYNFNSTQGQSASSFGDSTIFLGFQLLKDNPDNWVPDLRFTISETFPFGTYENLNPNKLGADSLGMGSYQTSFTANFQKLLRLRNTRFIMLHLTLMYTILASTHVSGLNSYGGGIGTNGRVKPGSNFLADFGFEYSLTQNWVPAMELILTTNKATTFNGFPGLTPSGLLAPVGIGSQVNLSIIPELEYNFSSHVGAIGGIWFSMTGKNSSAFAGGIVSVNFYY